MHITEKQTLSRAYHHHLQEQKFLMSTFMKHKKLLYFRRPIRAFFHFNEHPPHNPLMHSPTYHNRYVLKTLQHFVNSSVVNHQFKISINTQLPMQNVSNTKNTKRWHRNARLSGFLPSFSIGYDFSKDTNIDLDRGSTSADDVYISGPKNRNRDLNLSVEWDLGTLLWNSNQTAIDYREKYMVEMRDEIVHHVTSLYFERQKLQMERLNLNSEESLEYLTLCMRIDELTAHIDGLTGGWFSEEISKSQGSSNKGHGTGNKRSR